MQDTQHAKHTCNMFAADDLTLTSNVSPPHAQCIALHMLFTVHLLQQIYIPHPVATAFPAWSQAGPPPCDADKLCSPGTSSSALMSMQGQFGAYQVILVRDHEGLEALPPRLRNSDALVMTIAQAKGLEFDDVVLYNFFDGSRADWRYVNNFVEHLQQTEREKGYRALPAGAALVEVGQCALQAVLLTGDRCGLRHQP